MQQIAYIAAFFAALFLLVAAAAGYRAGNGKLLGYFVGQLMKETGGKANPAAVNAILKAKLGL